MAPVPANLTGDSTLAAFLQRGDGDARLPELRGPAKHQQQDGTYRLVTLQDDVAAPWAHEGDMVAMEPVGRLTAEAMYVFMLDGVPKVHQVQIYPWRDTPTVRLMANSSYYSDDEISLELANALVVGRVRGKFAKKGA